MATLPTWAIIAAGVLLMSPSLATGFVADDYLHQLSVRENPGIAGLRHQPWDLFRFADGNEASARRLMDEGVFPWWADTRVVLSFFRPLASLTHRLDYRFWPSSPALMHAQSLVWFALLLAVVALVFRRFQSAAFAGGLATLLFAVDDAHAPVVGWLANRNMIIALALAIPALAFHDEWRKTQRRGAAVLAHASLLLGLCASEAATMVIAYLVAYALCLERAPLRRRLFSLAGYLALFAVFRLLYDHFGYGVTGSGIYIDPRHAPFRFALAAVTRLPVLLLAQFALPYADFWEFYPMISPLLQPLVLAVSGATFFALFCLLRPLLVERAEARFWLVGTLGAAIPACATFPHDRLLLGPGIGAMALLGELFARALRRSWRPSLPTRTAVLGLLTLHLGLAPILAMHRSASVAHLDALLQKQDATVPIAASIRQRTLVLLNPPLDPFGAYFSLYREARGEPRPAHLYWLATGVSELRVTTEDARTLTIRPRGGYLASSSQRMLRSLDRPIAAFQPMQLSEASFEVSELTRDGRPAAVRVTFRRGLDHASLLFLQWRAGGYVSFTPPAVGQSVLVPAVDLGAAMWG